MAGTAGQTVAVVGNPNSGKTTLFNGLTGSSQRIGNWPGVTVEKKEGTVTIDGERVTLVDLPGIYALTAQSEDERVSRDYVLSGEPRLVVNILDATNLERNLYLTTQLLEMGLPILLVANMIDLAAGKNITLDIDRLGAELGCPAVGVDATKPADLARLVAAIGQALGAASGGRVTGSSTGHDTRASVRYPPEVESAVASWAGSLHDLGVSLGATGRWLALKALEGDEWTIDRVVAAGVLTREQIERESRRLEASVGEAIDVVLAESRYSLIQRVAGACLHRGAVGASPTERIDKVVLHRFLGIPVFMIVMYLMFWVTINVGGAFIDFFGILTRTFCVDGFGHVLVSLGSPTWLTTILAGGIGAGIQTLATFIPIIFTMFFTLSLLEDSGYMARAAFVMDRFLRAIGLPGKAFVPMLVGFGCSVPAIMSTRTLENKRDRYMTIFMTPLMSCGARLPVYALFGAAFFGAAAMNMVFSMYLAGILLAIVTGLLLKNTLFKGEATHFVMELPPYHAPRMRNILTYSWSRLSVFMLRTKTVIVAVAILATMNSLGVDGTFGNENTSRSVLTQIGRTMTPVFTPMGIERQNWPATVGIFTGIFAKEAVVGTLNSLYSQSDHARKGRAATAAPFSLWSGIREAFGSVPSALAALRDTVRDPLGLGVVGGGRKAVAAHVGANQRVYGPLRRHFPKGRAQAYAYLLFILIYFPCVAAFGAILREMGAAYGSLAMAYLTVLAWVVATLFYQLAVARQALWIGVPIVLLLAVIGFLRWLGRGPGAGQPRKQAA